jgi:hypothetical protein
LYALSQEVPDVFQSIVTSQREMYNSLVDRRAKQFAELEMLRADRYLRYAVIDFNRGDYSDSYTNLHKSGRLLASVEQIYEEQRYAQQVRDILDEYDENLEHVRKLINTSPGGFQWIYNLRTSNHLNAAILRGSEPQAFLEAMYLTYNKMRVLPHPASMNKLHKQAVQCLEKGYESARLFDKFKILNHYDAETARSIVREAYTKLRESRDEREDLMEAFEIKGLQFPMLTEQQLIAR